MYILKCDRCGKETETTNPLWLVHPDKNDKVWLPRYSIKFAGTNAFIYLCDRCEKDFDVFLKEFADEC